MPLYYFDCTCDDVSFPDHYGIALADEQEVADQAACLIKEMMVENTEALGAKSISVVVRNEEHASVYAAYNNFHGHLIPRKST